MQINRIKRGAGLKMAKKIMNEMQQEPKGIHYPGYKRRVCRASEIVANQPLVQDILSRHLGIKK
ncbi:MULTISPECIES: hypothetical protein [Metabacillus]|jgi:hypothetical protein|uniref:Uncharacterized protein n=3 Tax=Metabacillus TaxID=2675233 RepID=A0A179SWI9_9BACI|nr:MULTISPECIES: hypothetical protein [Metabacillus]OAS85995.1 hypothetical protein A6K24_22905 [Metabacillus litoralis]QNF30037.1 hypothetical protein HUW50_22690 [Metabacillus sp. KUDC1714]